MKNKSKYQPHEEFLRAQEFMLDEAVKAVGIPPAYLGVDPPESSVLKSIEKINNQTRTNLNKITEF
jgi:hypothetical protein